jgi:hypothetical protein
MNYIKYTIFASLFGLGLCLVGLIHLEHQQDVERERQLKSRISQLEGRLREQEGKNLELEEGRTPQYWYDLARSSCKE